jgi:hypothetical protein
MSTLYYARVDTETGARSHSIEAENPLEAALMFAETWVPPEAGDGEVRVIVQDCETGERQCYVVDLGEHDAEPC